MKTTKSTHRGVFITGTDTGVGKTVVTAALGLALRRQRPAVGVMKPVETGVPSFAATASDAARLKRTMGMQDSFDLVRPYRFHTPVAPLAAARLERRPISVRSIIRAFRTLRSRHSVMLVEGVGGVRVPLTSRVEILDLVVHLGLPVIVVGRSALGGINHAMLTLDALHQRKVPVLALVLSRSGSSRTATARAQERSTMSLLRQLASVPVVGPLPYIPSLRRNWSAGVARLARLPDIRKLARLVLSAG